MAKDGNHAYISDVWSVTSISVKKDLIGTFGIGKTGLFYIYYFIFGWNNCFLLNLMDVFRLALMVLVYLMYFAGGLCICGALWIQIAKSY